LADDYARSVPQWASILLVFLLLNGGLASAQPSKKARKQAAAEFARGEALYGKGEFAEAIHAFEEANRLSPHWRSLFNIARCYENMGDPAKSIAYYRRALAAKNIDPASRSDIRQRMKRLSSRPVKVFISSRPSGARVTVDGRAEPEPGQTPLVVKLPPGEHLLLLRKDGHHLEAKRIVVEMDKELPVEAKLEPLPAPCPPPAPPCPKPEPCPEPEQRVDLHNLHIHLHLLGAFGFTTERPMAGGPGVQFLGTFRRFVFGGHFLGLPMGQENVDGLLGKVTLETRNFYWLMGQFEGGYSFPFEHFYVYTTGAIGVSADRVVFRGTATTAAGETVSDSVTKEKFAFTWSVGGGIEAMATGWLSFGGALRFGMAHGKRVDKEAPGQRDHQEVNAPYATIWGTVSLHL
jgi:Tfp pilus assembly protein PilF